MKTIMNRPAPAGWKPKVGMVPPPDSGFSLMELTVAMAMFLVMAAPAFFLFNQQQASSLTQQGQTGLNVSLRNAVSQMQMDIVNGGTDQLPGANVPGWPVGVTIVNNVPAVGASCFSVAAGYGVNCFDQINVIAASSTVEPINATDSTGGNTGANCSDTSTGVAYGQAGSAPTVLTLAQTAANYSKGDQLLLVTGSSKFITTVVLTANAAVAGAAVKFTFNATAAKGSNTAANDPLSISTDGADSANNLTNSFCGGDWIIKLAPITYQVNIATATDPLLTRTQNGATATVMEQVIGFKVGASLVTNTNADTYYYDASKYPVSTCPCPPGSGPDQPFNFSEVRSLRISIIGRTPPSTNPNYVFRNAFDNGNYQVQGVSLVVNPRNMSMND